MAALRAGQGMRGWRRAAGAAALLALAVWGAGARAAAAAPAAEFAIDGWPGLRSEAEAIAAPALRAVRDSSALANVLARFEAELQDRGHLAASVSGAWRGGELPRLDVHVAAGPVARWAPVVIEAPSADSAAFAAALDCAPGRPASPRALGAAIVRAVDAAEAQGYAWASLGVGAWRVDSAGVHARLAGTRGPRVTVEGLRFDGMRTTRRDVAERAVGPLQGRPYDPAAARDATQRLEQLGVFRRVEYRGLLGGAEWSRGTLAWRVEEPRYNTFEGAVGVQGAAGAVGLARLELGNLLGTARAVGVSWQSRGRGMTDFGARYTEPMMFGRALRWEAALQQQVQDTTYTRFAYGLRARLALGGRDRLEGGLEQQVVVQPHGAVRDAAVRNTSFAIEHDGRDVPRAPRRGVRVRLEGSERHVTQTYAPQAAAAAAPDASGADVRLEGDAHARLGVAAGFALEWTAASHLDARRAYGDWERYPVGGAASLRGHDEEEFRADRYALARLEWRWFLGAAGERLALFWDHARMETRTADAAGAGTHLAERDADGVGFGLRLPAAGGDVDIDYGLAPGRGFLEGKIHLRLVTAF